MSTELFPSNGCCRLFIQLLLCNGSTCHSLIVKISFWPSDLSKNPFVWKLIVTQLVKKFAKVYETRRFSTAFSSQQLNLILGEMTLVHTLYL
jgi:hypothetical protein